MITPVQLQILRARHPGIGDATLLRNAATLLAATKPKEPRRIPLEPSPPPKTPTKPSNALESQGNGQSGEGMTLTLPYPPSTNTAWRSIVIKGQPRVLLSREGRAFKKAVAAIATAMRIQPLVGPIAYHLHVYRPQKQGDLSNRQKVLEDALQGYAYENDDQISHFSAWRHDDKVNPRVVITIFPFQTNAERKR